MIFFNISRERSLIFHVWVRSRHAYTTSSRSGGAILASGSRHSLLATSLPRVGDRCTVAARAHACSVLFVVGPVVARVVGRRRHPGATGGFDAPLDAVPVAALVRAAAAAVEKAARHSKEGLVPSQHALDTGAIKSCGCPPALWGLISASSRGANPREEAQDGSAEAPSEEDVAAVQLLLLRLAERCRLPLAYVVSLALEGAAHRVGRKPGPPLETLVMTHWLGLEVSRRMSYHQPGSRDEWACARCTALRLRREAAADQKEASLASLSGLLEQGAGAWAACLAQVRRRLPSGANAEACLAVFLADHGTALREEPQLGSTAGSLVPPLAASDSPAVAQEQQQPPALVPFVEGPGCAPVGVRFGSGRRPREAGSPNPHATGS